MGRLLLGLTLLIANSTCEAQETLETYLGGRMPYAVFDRLPVSRLAVPGGEIVVGIAPGTLQIQPSRLLGWIEIAAPRYASRSATGPPTTS